MVTNVFLILGQTSAPDGFRPLILVLALSFCRKSLTVHITWNWAPIIMCALSLLFFRIKKYISFEYVSNDMISTSLPREHPYFITECDCLDVVSLEKNGIISSPPLNALGLPNLPTNFLGPHTVRLYWVYHLAKPLCPCHTRCYWVMCPQCCACANVFFGSNVNISFYFSLYYFILRWSRFGSQILSC